MMEKKFLLNLLYSIFIQVRVNAYENNDETSIKLCNLFHNIPLSLIHRETANTAESRYKDLSERIEKYGMMDWLTNHIHDFNKLYPSDRSGISFSNYDKMTLYLIYEAIAEIRERASVTQDKITSRLCDLIYNIPLDLIIDEDGREAYKKFLEMIETEGLHKWLTKLQDDFLAKSLRRGW